MLNLRRRITSACGTILGIGMGHALLHIADRRLQDSSFVEMLRQHFDVERIRLGNVESHLLKPPLFVRGKERHRCCARYLGHLAYGACPHFDGSTEST